MDRASVKNSFDLLHVFYEEKYLTGMMSLPPVVLACMYISGLREDLALKEGDTIFLLGEGASASTDVCL